MLTYHPHYDTYHCIFRLLSACSLLEGKEIEISKLRIIDFYFVFPNLVANIQFPRIKGAAKLKSSSKSFPKPYEILPDTKRLFSEIGDFQIQALQILKAQEVIYENKFGKICPGKHFYHERIVSLLADSRYVNNDFFHDLAHFLYEVQLHGDSGLKKRTGLMEFRYDAV